ncbi:MAG: hypothetical protein KDE51_15980, partial [Anaerolineales bacterium]|nr:hypothetical protein [Anaerolineales bacterium]
MSSLSPARSFLKLFSLLGIALLLFATPTQTFAQPTFSKTFSPNTIGPGSVSTLMFTITNGEGVPVDQMAFTDVLPAGMTIATPASASSDCGGTVTAPDGGTTITFVEGGVGTGVTCTISVNVTSSTIGTHMNVSGDLTSSAGNSGPATADLIVTASRPGFSKSFSPAAILLGGRSTLTFTIDNTANPSLTSFTGFTDNLPVGMVIANHT